MVHALTTKCFFTSVGKSTINLLLESLCINKNDEVLRRGKMAPIDYEKIQGVVYNIIVTSMMASMAFFVCFLSVHHDWLGFFSEGFTDLFFMVYVIEINYISL